MIITEAERLKPSFQPNSSLHYEVIEDTIDFQKIAYSIEISLLRRCSMTATATKILWGQILTVLLIELATTWGATEYVAWRLGFQAQLGPPGSPC